MSILRVAVTFKQPGGPLGPVTFGSTIPTSAIDRFRPDPSQLARAAQELTRLGFQVTASGALTLSVRGDRSTFERTFGTQLVEMQTDLGPSVTQRGPAALGAAAPLASTVLFPPAGAPWSPDPGLAAVIEDAYIQWPHIYMSRFAPPPAASPLPPASVTSHHLRVPGDVSLLLNADRVHRRGYTGKRVRVAMIDSGFAHGHAYFTNRGYRTSGVLAPGATFVQRDGNGHGTGESANLLAIAPDARFIGVKLDNEDDPAQSASVLEGLQEALKHDPHIISVSLGYDLCNRTTGAHLATLPNSLRALEAEIQAAVASGIAVVFSAGNGHVAFPGMMPDVISAGGVYVDASGAMQASDYASAFDSQIYAGRAVPDFCGLVGMQPRASYIMLPIEPGCAIDRGGAAHDGTAPADGWGVFSGTSAAAPQIAGVCALLLQKDRSLTPADLKAILRRTSRDVVRGSASAASSDTGAAKAAGPGADGATGTGLVDAFEAWNQV